jgi:hypothetical protein
VTRFGQLLDPAADKILIAAAFVSLVELDSRVTPSWMVVAILAREFAVNALRSHAALEQVVIPAGLSGKIKTGAQIVAISLLIIYNKLGEFSHLAPISLWVAVIVTLYSGADYFVRYWRLGLRAAAPTRPALGPFDRADARTAYPLRRSAHRLVFSSSSWSSRRAALLPPAFDPTCCTFCRTRTRESSLSRNARAVRQHRLLRGRHPHSRGGAARPERADTLRCG